MPLMLLEHDAKVLLQSYGIHSPSGILVASPETAAAYENMLPLVVKAQVPVGGRGKAGGIVVANTVAELRGAVTTILGLTIRNHRVEECRLEPLVEGWECYLSLTLEPSLGVVRVLFSTDGGVDVEAQGAATMRTRDAAFSADDVEEAICDIARSADPPYARALEGMAAAAASAFFALNAIVLEINPLFVGPDGTVIAGDAKLLVDDNALARNGLLAALLQQRAGAYKETERKRKHGFDFVVLDQNGELGLLTTGAGLSMQLVDEITARGFSPYNFCDIRTGQMRGDPSRLMIALQWLAEGPKVRSVLMNFFAGVTDLQELAQLLLVAIARTPELNVPITIRVIGNGLEGAMEMLRAAPARVRVEQDLEKALTMSLAPLARGQRP